MEAELVQKIEGHLESIAGSLKMIVERTPDTLERQLEGVFTAILVNAAQDPTPNRALELVNNLDRLLQDISSSTNLQ